MRSRARRINHCCLIEENGIQSPLEAQGWVGRHVNVRYGIGEIRDSAEGSLRRSGRLSALQASGE